MITCAVFHLFLTGKRALTRNITADGLTALTVADP